MYWTAAAFAAHPEIAGIVVVAGASETEQCREAVAGLPNVLAVVPGGASRQESVAMGLYALGGAADDVILVHDGARPLVTSAVIDRCLAGVRAHGSAVAALPVNDTLKAVDAESVVTRTVDRGGLWAVQTPQAFTRDLLFEAHVAARDAGFTGTDEAALVERLEVPVHLVPGAPDNFKITRPEDLTLAEAVLAQRLGVPTMTETRVGFGYDIHRFTTGRPLMLGGVPIPDPLGRGLDGHSDADVLIHALCDALLGAAGLPDIGVLFPNTDPAYHNIASQRLLENVAARVGEAGFQIVNVDTTLIAESPKIAPYVAEMRQILAAALRVDGERVGIKATTNERLGALGQAEGIAAHAVASLRK